MVNKSEAGAFHLITGPRPDAVRKQIAEICALPAHDVKDTEVIEIVSFLVGVYPYLGSDTKDKYFNGDKREWSSRAQGITQRAEVLFDLPIKGASYGISIPSYLSALEKQAEENGRNGEHNALLVGALTADSVKEFSTTVRTAFPQAKCTVIDINPTSTQQASADFAQFTVGDALAIPFGSGTMQSVHTNLLVPNLVGTGIAEVDQKKLFREASRVLSSDGMLLMIEPPVTDPVIDDLHYAGFRSISVMQLKQFKRRTHMEKFLRSTAKEPIPQTVTTNNAMNVIVARKDNARYAG